MTMKQWRRRSGLFDASVDVSLGLDVADERDDALEQLVLVRVVLALQRFDLHLGVFARCGHHLISVAQLLFRKRTVSVRQRARQG